MTELEQAIQAIETGLVKVTRSEERPASKMALSQRMTDYNVPGFSVAYVYQEELAWASGYGVLEAGGEKPVTHATIFQAASISKPVTVMVALHLVEAGLRDGMTRFGHPGWNEGFHSILLGCLETGQGLVWMANGENGRNLGLEVSCGLAEIVRWTWW
jgi:hypothetical protein